MLGRAIGLALLGIAVAGVAVAGVAAARRASADGTALLARYEPVLELYRADWKPAAVEPFLAGQDA